MTHKHIPLRPCGTCQTPVPDGKCPRHPKAAHRYRPDRPSVVKSVYGPQWRTIRLVVLNKAMWKCAYCSAPANTADHVIPHSRGGQSIITNLEAACAACNNSKANRTLTEWCALPTCPPTARSFLARRLAEGLPS